MKHQHYPRARKRFGQNFLIDQSIIDDVISAINPQVDEHLVEVGPGRGALTEPLLKRCKRLDAIELDRDLIPPLRTKLFNYPNLTIHEADALKFDYCSLIQKDEKLRIIGNLPYNITTPLLFHILAQAEVIQDMCFMLQREVVERICAPAGSKQYGRLSVMVQYQCQAEQLFIVPAEAFEPVPKVESAIIYLRPFRDEYRHEVCAQTLGKIVTQAFSQRRKTIANTLKKLIAPESLRAAGIAPEQRPETVTVEQYMALTRVWIASGGDKS